MSKQGKVVLVGAGPGDPDLLTIKALKALNDADVVVYDRLVSAEIRDLIPAGTVLIGAGKSPGRHTMTQDEINDLLITLARTGRRVVRLKGGDPFIFGRGGEEALALARAGIDYDVVPGITSAQGCAAAARIPLTHRGTASSLRFITGHCREGRELDLDWPSLTGEDTTLVVYMGHASMERIAANLIAHGLAADTPAAAIMCATTDREWKVAAPLANIAAAAREAGMTSPVLYIIGRVVDTAAALGFQADEYAQDHSVCLG